MKTHWTVIFILMVSVAYSQETMLMDSSILKLNSQYDMTVPNIIVPELPPSTLLSEPNYNLRRKMFFDDTPRLSDIDFTISKKDFLPKFSYNPIIDEHFEYNKSLNVFSVPDLDMNQLSIMLYQNNNFLIQSNRAVFNTGYEGINAAGVSFQWNINRNLSLSFSPSVGNYYYSMERPYSNYFGNLKAGLKYQLTDWLTLEANGQYSFGNQAPHLAPFIYPQKNLGGGAIIQIFEQLGIAMGIEYVYEAGQWRPRFYIAPVFFLKPKKKKKQEIPEYWF